MYILYVCQGIKDAGTVLSPVVTDGEVCTVFGCSIVTLFPSPLMVQLTVEHPARNSQSAATTAFK